MFILIQACIGGSNLADFDSKSAKGKPHNVNQDTSLIMKNANRLGKGTIILDKLGMVNIFLAKADYNSSISALHIAQAVQCKMWNYSSNKLSQVEGIGPQYTRLLAKAGIDTFRALSSAEPSKIEMLLTRNPPFGTRVIIVLIIR